MAKLFGTTGKTICAAIDSGTIKGFVVPGTGRRRVFHRDLIRYLRDDPQYRPLLSQIEGPPPTHEPPSRAIRRGALPSPEPETPVSAARKRRGPVPKPWYREGTDGWYVKLDGRQFPLKVKGRENEHDAIAAFARMSGDLLDGSLAPPAPAPSLLDAEPLGEILRRLSRQVVELQRELIGLKVRVVDLEGGR